LSATPVRTPPTDFAEFRLFAVEIDAAVSGADADFFASRGVEMELTCRGDEQLGPCSGRLMGEVIRGIPGAAWRSDAFGISPRDDYRAMVADWLTSALPEQSDDAGGGSPRLASLAWQSESGEYYAMVTLIREAGPATGIQRQARIFRFEYNSVAGDWLLNGEIFGAVSISSNDWLSGGCSECYDYWELWQGAPD
jgi:hypothetical protein